MLEICVHLFITLPHWGHAQNIAYVERFPHRMGYWPPEYNASILDIKSTKGDYFYNPTQTAVAKRLKTSVLEQLHTIQVSILLPSNYKRFDDGNNTIISEALAPAQKRSGIGTLIGFETLRNQKLIRDDILFNITLRDSKCDETYGVKSFLDAYADGVHVLFGPSCDYALGK